jgi:hypothetical protein
MEEINITYWDNINKTLKNVQVHNYGLIQAIEQIRYENDYNIIVLSVEYSDIQGTINKLA